jgi:hypothetical protein
MNSGPGNAEQSENPDPLAEILAGIIDNTSFFPVPPREFDPRRADPERLREFGLPPQPDRLTQPEQYTFWWKMFSPPLHFVKPKFSIETGARRARPILPRPRLRVLPSTRFGQGRPLAPIAGRPVIAAARPVPTAGTHHATSSNWSGAHITPKLGPMFTQVHGSWRVPTASAPPAPVDGEYRCSTWIGLDGQRRYLDSSLPQIGTTQIVTIQNGQRSEPTAKAWWQWWVRDVDNPPPIDLSLHVGPGHCVMCSIIVVNRTTVRFFIKNQTTGDFVAPFDEPAPMAAKPAVQVQVSGATAEWIVERPMIWHEGKLYQWPNYGTVQFQFKNCLAVSSAAPGSAGRSETLAGARLINMFEVRENPHRIAEISVAKRKGDRVEARYQA